MAEKNVSDEKPTIIIKKSKSNIILILLLIAIILGMLAYIIVPKIINQTNIETESQILSLKFKDIGNLVTQTSQMTIVKKIEDDRKIGNFVIPFSKSARIFSYDVDVDAAVNFEKVSYEVDESRKTILIKLPHAVLNNASINHDSLRIWRDDESVFSRIDLDEQNSATKELIDEAKATSLSNGLLEKADTNAKQLLSSFISGDSHYKDYKVEFSYIESNETSVPETTEQLEETTKTTDEQ